MSPPLFLVDRAAAPGAVLSVTGAEGRHAGRVQRLRVGETCLLSDGLGWVGVGEVSAVTSDGIDVRLESASRRPPPQPRIIVVQALPKGERAELTVAMLTEVGVDEIVPWAADRCVARWTGDRVQRGRHRWSATARESAKQSRRPFVPAIGELAGLARAAQLCAASDLAVVLEAAGAARLADVGVPAGGTVVVVVGPEGGLADREREALVGAGAIEARLSPQILRTSTAGPVAVALLQSRTQRWAETYPWIS